MDWLVTRRSRGPGPDGPSISQLTAGLLPLNGSHTVLVYLGHYLMVRIFFDCLECLLVYELGIKIRVGTLHALVWD